jgi:hypothetical protein
VTSTDTTTAPTSITTEFRVRNEGEAYGAYAALTGANLSGALAALSGYDSDVGFYMQIRFTANATDSTLLINQVYCPTNVDSTYMAEDGSVTLVGPNPTDVTTMYLASDDSTITTFTGSGTKAFSGSATYFGQNIYFIRRDSGGEILCTLKTQPQAMTVGDNGDVNLFFGDEIQLAQSSEVTLIKAAVDAYLDAAISDVLADTAAIEELVNADEVHTTSTIQKLRAGTATVLLTKNHSGRALVDFQAVEP